MSQSIQVRLTFLAVLTVHCNARFAKTPTNGQVFLGVKSVSRLQPEVVAPLLAKVETEWQHQASSFIACNTTGQSECSSSSSNFEKSCSTVANTLFKGSNGDRLVVKEYSEDICRAIDDMDQHRELCRTFGDFIYKSMSANAYENRVDMLPAPMCRRFWSQFVVREQARHEDERVEKEELEKREAEARAKEEKKQKEDEEARAKLAAQEAQEEAERRAKEAQEAAEEEEASKKAAEEKAQEPNVMSNSTTSDMTMMNVSASVDMNATDANVTSQTQEAGEESSNQSVNATVEQESLNATTPEMLANASLPETEALPETAPAAVNGSDVAEAAGAPSATTPQNATTA